LTLYQLLQILRLSFSRHRSTATTNISHPRATLLTSRSLLHFFFFQPKFFFMKTVDIPPCQLFSLGQNDFVEIYKEQVPSNRRRRGPHPSPSHRYMRPPHNFTSSSPLLLYLFLSVSNTQLFFPFLSSFTSLSISFSSALFPSGSSTRQKIKHKHMSHSGSSARVTAKRPA
jgi:hypothetical protein